MSANPAECKTKAEEDLKQCLTRCDNPPKPPSCGDLCQRNHEALVKLCEGAPDPAACKLRADELLKQCLAFCEALKPPTPFALRPIP